MTEFQDWTEFALEAEYEHFGMTRIALRHNLLLGKYKDLLDLLAEIQDQVDRYEYLHGDGGGPSQDLGPATGA